MVVSYFLKFFNYLVLYVCICIWFGVILCKDIVFVKKVKFVLCEFYYMVMYGFCNNYLVLYGWGFEGYFNYMLVFCVNVFFVKLGCWSLFVFFLIM